MNASISIHYRVRNVWIIAVMDLLCKPNVMTVTNIQGMVARINARYNLDSNVLMAQKQ